jgi:hypothetical protein
MADSLVVQWNTGTGADDNYYQRIDTHSSTPLTFADAEADAAGMTLVEGATTYHGELAILDPDYTDAFNFIETNVMYPSGSAAPQSEMYWVGASSPDGNKSPNNWTWINGVAVPDSVVNGWNIDHAEGSGAEGAGFFQNNNQLWDYIATAGSNLAYGYVVEFVPNSVPTPAALGGGVALIGGLLLKRRSW